MGDQEWRNVWFGTRGRGSRVTVTDSPQVTEVVSAAFAFQRHSRTVMVRCAVSMVTTWKDNRVSSVAETAPFIGESTLKTCSRALRCGPFHS